MDKLTASIELVRDTDHGGGVATRITFERGMPSRMVVEQVSGGKVNVVDFTMSEAHLFRYALGEFRQFENIVKDSEDDHE